ncbi:MAG TPA: AMP-binding protein, partial [Acidimicrobiales bacterium]|nr:AMP-binding protein [Acidimicrobiales bacterium]
MDSERFNGAGWLVDRHVAAGGAGAVAFRGAGGVVTYGDLQRATWTAARALSEMGVGRGDRVILVIRDEPAFPAAFLGGLRLGAVPVPVSTMLRPREVAAIAADSGAVAAVVSAAYAGHLAPMREASPGLKAAAVVGAAPGTEAGGLPVFDWDGFADGDEMDPAPTTASSPGFWLYTSGTTGTPKGAIHRHGDLRAVAETYGRHVLGIRAEDVCYSVAKLFFAFGLGNSLIFPLAVGASSVLDPEPPAPARAGALLAEHRPTLFFAPPGFCAAMVDAGLPGDALATVRYTVTAGEALPAEILRRFTERFGTEMLDGIGSTEALHIFCSNHPGDVRPGTSGRP